MMLCDQKFAGPLDIQMPGVKAVPGVYAIVCECKDGAKRMVDVASSAALDQSLRDVENLQKWRKIYEGRLTAFVWYSPTPDQKDARDALAQAINDRYAPWCRREARLKGQYA
jgi:hypothetical protein